LISQAAALPGIFLRRDLAAEKRLRKFMAKVLYTAFMADARGKVNGSVFSKNRSGAYVRTKVTPVNRQTATQQLARGRFSARSAGWRGLTEAQRLSWSNAAPNFPVFDIFGNSKILSGSALYNMLNLNLAQAGQAAITTAPSPVAIASLVSAALISDVSDGTVSLTCGLTPVPAGFTAVVFATPQYGPGQYFVKNKYRFLQTVAAAGTLAPALLFTAYTALFGSLVAGNKISVKVFLVSNTTGQAGVPFSAVATITA
jgi:hypothetical protein